MRGSVMLLAANSSKFNFCWATCLCKRRSVTWGVSKDFVKPSTIGSASNRTSESKQGRRVRPSSFTEMPTTRDLRKMLMGG